MNDDQLSLLIQHRLSQSRDTLREAHILLEKSAYRGSINRSYYAMFYAVSALLATKGLGSSKHSGVISLFDKEFVKTGEFPKELSRFIHHAFDERQSSDYDEMLDPDELRATQVLSEAKSFVSSIQTFVTVSGFDKR
ncbi:MAG: HEPN domain-containing protein [SAR324 cluster bacterium]|nr:HEPN domain-containing protein [SAR324 cluster bacterium]